MIMLAQPEVAYYRLHLPTNGSTVILQEEAGDKTIIIVMFVICMLFMVATVYQVFHDTILLSTKFTSITLLLSLYSEY